MKKYGIAIVLLLVIILGFAITYNETNPTEYYELSAYESTLLDYPRAELNNHSLREVFEDSSIYGVGKNLTQLSDYEQGDIAGTGVNTNGGNANIVRTKDYISVLSSTAYTVSHNTPLRYSIKYYDVNKSYITTTVFDQKTSSYTFTTPSNARYIRYAVLKPTTIPFTPSELINDYKWQLEKGTVATTYAPYKSSLNNDLPPFVNWYNLDTLGIQTLTFSQMDYWYSQYLRLKEKELIDIQTYKLVAAEDELEGLGLSIFSGLRDFYQDLSDLSQTIRGIVE